MSREKVEAVITSLKNRGNCSIFTHELYDMAAFLTSKITFENVFDANAELTKVEIENKYKNIKIESDKYLLVIDLTIKQ